MKSSRGASAGTSKPLPQDRGSAGIAIDNRYCGAGNWLRRSCISMMQLFVSFGLTGISQSMSTPSYPFATTKSYTFCTNVARSDGSAAILRKACACAGSPPPIEISTFTPAACAFAISDWLDQPVGHHDVADVLLVEQQKRVRDVRQLLIRNVVGSVGRRDSTSPRTGSSRADASDAKPP